MAPGDYPVLPEDTGIYYYSEGAANIVYRISVPWPTPPPTAVEEYGDGTPPPSEIEEADKNPANHYLQIFDCK
jgi:inositol-pentakisphosphate 2-kinase